MVARAQEQAPAWDTAAFTRIYYDGNLYYKKSKMAAFRTRW